MESMEALALLDIDQEDDNLLMAWNDNPGNENTAAEEPSLLLGIMSPPSPSLVSHKPEKWQVFGDSQNCPGEVEDPGNIAMSKNPGEMLAASNSISVLSVLDSNVISSSNMTHDALDDGASRKAQCTKDLMHDGILRMASVSKGLPMDNTYIDKARQQRQVIGSPEKVEDEPIVLRRNRTRRLTTLRKSLAWDKAFFTDDGVLDNEELFAIACDTPMDQSMPELNNLWDGPPGHLNTSLESVPNSLVMKKDKVSSTLPKAKLQVEISGTHAPSSSVSRAVKQVQRTSLHSIPTALPWPQKQAPGIKSNPLTALSNAAGKTQRFSSALKEPGLSAATHRQVSSMSKKVKDSLGKVMPGQGPSTSALHPLQCRHTSQKTSAVSKRLGGLPTVPEVKEGSNRVHTTASDTTINGVFTVRDMPHAKEVLSSPCMDFRKQVPRLTRSKTAMVVPGLVIGLSASTGDNGPTPAEPLSADKPSGLRKPSPKLGFFDSAQAMAGPQSVSATRQPFSNTARQALQTGKTMNHSSGGVDSITPSNLTPDRDSHLQCLLLGRSSSSIPYAPYVQLDGASAPATPRACLISPVTPRGSSSESTRFPVPKGLHASRNPSGSFCREQMSDTLQLTANKLSESETSDIALHVTGNSQKKPNPQVNRSDNDLQGLPDPQNGKASALCAESDAQPVQCRLVLDTDGGDCGTVKTVLTLSMSEEDITSRYDHGADSHKEILAERAFVQHCDRELPGGPSNSSVGFLSEAVSMPADHFSAGNIGSAQDCGSQPVGTSDLTVHVLDRAAPSWMAKSDCLQHSQIILSVPMGSLCGRFIHEAPTELGSSSPVADKESSLVQESMKTTDLATQLVHLTAASLHSQNSGSEKGEIEGTEVTSLPSDMIVIAASSPQKSPGTACDHCQQLDSEQSSITGNDLILRLGSSILPAASMSSGDSVCVQSENSSLLRVAEASEASPKSCTPPVNNDSFHHNCGIQHSRQYKSSSIKGSNEDPATSNSLPAHNRYSQNSGYKIYWHSSSPGSRSGAGVAPKVTAITPVSSRSGKCRKLLAINDPADASVPAMPIETNSGLLLLLEQQMDMHTAINATGGSKIDSSKGSPTNAQRQTVDSQSSQWSDWSVHGASIVDCVKQVDGTPVLKSQCLRPSTEEGRGLIYDTPPGDNCGSQLTRTTSLKVASVETDNVSNRCPLAGLNVSDAYDSNKKEKGLLLSYARKAASWLTSSPISANAAGQENCRTPITCKTPQSRTPSSTCPKDSKAPSLSSDERIYALEVEDSGKLASEDWASEAFTPRQDQRVKLLVSSVKEWITT